MDDQFQRRNSSIQRIKSLSRTKSALELRKYFGMIDSLADIPDKLGPFFADKFENKYMIKAKNLQPFVHPQRKVKRINMQQLMEPNFFEIITEDKNSKGKNLKKN